jgi:hypothetical protein
MFSPFGCGPGLLCVLCVSAVRGSSNLLSITRRLFLSLQRLDGLSAAIGYDEKRRKKKADPIKVGQ